jgi:hypothetical protein
MIFVWYIPLLLLALLLWILFRRQSYRICPFFFSYVAYGVIADVTRLVVRLFCSPLSYPPTYWLTEAGYCLLGIFAMYEVVGTALLSIGRAWRMCTIIVVLVASVLLGFARSQVHPVHYGSAFPPYVVIGEIAVRFVQVFVFAGLATLGPLIGLRLRRYSFGVAVGFGFYATVMLMSTSRYADMGRSFAPLWRMLSIAAYSVAVLIWIWFFWRPAKIEDPESSALGPALG